MKKKKPKKKEKNQDGAEANHFEKGGELAHADQEDASQNVCPDSEPSEDDLPDIDAIVDESDFKQIRLEAQKVVEMSNIDKIIEKRRLLRESVAD